MRLHYTPGQYEALWSYIDPDLVDVRRLKPKLLMTGKVSVGYDEGYAAWLKQVFENDVEPMDPLVFSVVSYTVEQLRRNYNFV